MYGKVLGTYIIIVTVQPYKCTKPINLGILPSVNKTRIPMKKVLIYGIRNCDTIKKTLAWLSDHKIEYQFHDYKKEGINVEKLNEWANQTGWEILLNKKGTTWKKLNESLREGITDQAAATELMSEQTSLIKRPVGELDEAILAVGFDESVLRQKLL